VPRLTIVIPWIGPAAPCEETLAAVLQHRPTGCEVVVALADHYDDPYRLGEEVRFLPGDGERARDFVSLVNRGVAVAEADIVNIIPCGLLATEDWASAALLQFAAPEVAAVAPVIVGERDRQRVTSAGVNYTLGGVRQLAQCGRPYEVSELVRSQPLGATLAGGFFRKAVVDALGGFDARMGLDLADVDFALCLEELGLRTECEPTSLYIDARKSASGGSFAQGIAAERLFWRHLEPATRRAAMPNHALRLVGELALCLVQPWWIAHLAGRACGLLTGGFDRTHAKRIERAQAQLATCDEPAADIVRLPNRARTPGDAQQRRAA
jgi:hypothetical protein